MIEILGCGALTTVQDLGRHGHRRLGIGSGGAMDLLALRAANRLLGNPDTAAGIEITASAFHIRFEADAVFALCGAEAAAVIGGVTVPSWWAHPVRAGEELRVERPKAGMRGYLAIRGGLDVPVVLGSRSTDLKAGFGGHESRPLREGDRLAWGRSDPVRFPPRGFGARMPALVPTLSAPGEDDPGATCVRAIPAAEYEAFPTHVHDAFWGADWTLRPDSNRTGLRLAGPDLIADTHNELLSHGIIPGVIQVPPGGQPIVQMCDANTAGGYPKIAVVVAADLWCLAQARPNGRVRFVRVDQAAAFAAAARVEEYLDDLARGSRLVHGLI